MGSRIREHVAQLPDNSTTDHPDKVPLKKGKTTSYCEFREGVYSILKVLHNWSFNCQWRWKLQALRASVYPETIADICRSYNVKWSKRSVEQFARLPHRYIHITCVYTLSQRMPTFNLTYSVKYINRCTCHVSIVAEYHRNTKMRLENIALLTAFYNKKLLQEAQLPQTDCVTRRVSQNLANCCITV